MSSYILDTLKKTAERVADGTYSAMVDAMFPTNPKTASFTQDSFYTWRIFGSPYMLLDDPPLGEMTNSGFLGEWYLDQLKQSQILTIKMGIPRYTGNRSGLSVIDWFNGTAQAMNQGSGTTESIMNSLVGMISMNATGLDEAKRNYVFYNQYEIYLQYVRLLIVSMASYLGILDYPIPDIKRSSNGSYKPRKTSIAKMDWTTYTTGGYRPKSLSDIFGDLWDSSRNRWSSNTDDHLDQDNVRSNVRSNVVHFVETVSSLSQAMEKTRNTDFTDTYFDAAGGPPAIIQFVIQPSYSVDDFTNSTQQSMMQQTADKRADYGREIAWLTGVGGESSLTSAVAGVVNSGASGIQTAIDNMHMDPAMSILGSSVVGMIRGLTGERMIFPEIYEKSTFSRSNTYNIKLATPNGDPYSYFMNIGLPLCYLIPMVAPKTTSANAYRMPFMCQAYVTGQVAIPMGIVDGMRITRGSSGAMNKDGLPLEVDVSLSIKDLYSVLGVSALSDPAQFLSNESLIEYIASFTQIETWNKSLVNQYIGGSISDAIIEESMNVDKLWDRIKYNIAEFAGNQLRLYGIADSLR